MTKLYIYIYIYILHGLFLYFYIFLLNKSSKINFLLFDSFLSSEIFFFKNGKMHMKEI